MRYILCIILAVSTALSKAGETMPYHIEGKLEDQTKESFAYLYIAATPSQPSSLVSVPISDNRFIISGSVKQSAGKYSIARLFISEKPGIKLNDYRLLVQKGKLEYRELILEPQLTIVIGSNIQTSEVEGGELNEVHSTLQQILLECSRSNDSLKKLYRAALLGKKSNISQTKKLQAAYNLIFAEQKDKQTCEFLNYIRDNPTSMPALDKLTAICSDKKISVKKFTREFEQILSVVPASWLQTLPGKALTQKVKTLRASQRLIAGAQLPDYVFRDGSDTVAVRSFQGKYLLVHFWTSWSENCELVQEDLENAFEKYSYRGLAILQISLDANIYNWKMALPEEGVAWKQARCKVGWDLQVEKTFEIYGLPTNYLIDQDGKIISRNLWGKDLQQKLGELMR